MWVKICGTTNLADATTALKAGADAVGFVFAESKRKVTPELVMSISASLPCSIERIGVFTTQDVAATIDAVQIAGLTGVQLHSEYDPEVVREIVEGATRKLRMLQVVAFPFEVSEGAVQRFESVMLRILADANVDNVLLDTSVGGASGGTGVTFDWAAAAPVLERLQSSFSGGNVILAGGLRPENVREAVDVLHPWGVDVVSGVERSAGYKDPLRVARFVSEARGAQNKTRHDSGLQRYS